MFYLYEISHFLAFLCPALTFYIFCLPDYLPKIIHYWPALGGVSRKSRKKFDTPVFRNSLDDVTRKGCLRMRTPLKSDFPLFLQSINRNQAVTLMWKNNSSNEGKKLSDDRVYVPCQRHNRPRPLCLKLSYLREFKICEKLSNNPSANF